jgi:hypothetical protein
MHRIVKFFGRFGSKKYSFLSRIMSSFLLRTILGLCELVQTTHCCWIEGLAISPSLANDPSWVINYIS